MEKLTRMEKMLIKCQLMEEIRRLESINDRIEKKKNRSNSDLMSYTQNQSYINQYNKIIGKLND